MEIQPLQSSPLPFSPDDWDTIVGRIAPAARYLREVHLTDDQVSRMIGTLDSLVTEENFTALQKA